MGFVRFRVRVGVRARARFDAPMMTMQSLAHHWRGTRYTSMKSQKPIQSSTPAEIATIASSIAIGFRWGDGGLAALDVRRIATKPNATPPTRTHISMNAQKSGLVKAWRALGVLP